MSVQSNGACEEVTYCYQMRKWKLTHREYDLVSDLMSDLI